MVQGEARKRRAAIIGHFRYSFPHLTSLRDGGILHIPLEKFFSILVTSIPSKEICK